MRSGSKYGGHSKLEDVYIQSKVKIEVNKRSEIIIICSFRKATVGEKINDLLPENILSTLQLELGKCLTSFQNIEFSLTEEPSYSKTKNELTCFRQI